MPNSRDFNDIVSRNNDPNGGNNAGLINTEDVLGFTNQNGITGTYSNSTGVLTLAGSASVADYQNALASVTYVDTERSCQRRHT